MEKGKIIPPPKKKEKKDRYRFRKMQSDLDILGITTCIERISKKHFVFLVNGEAVKAFKSRQSINLRIEKLFKKHGNINPRRTNPKSLQ